MTLTERKTQKWLNGIRRASNYDRITDLCHQVTRNSSATGSADRFIYQCRTVSGKLLADRKVDVGVAANLVDSWQGSVSVDQ